MNHNPAYPLEQVLSIKKKRFDQALKVVAEKKALLDKAKAKLYDVIKERDEVLSHKETKLEQLREALDTGTTSHKIQQMKEYLNIVEGRLFEKEKKVTEQKKVVEEAERQVQIATEAMFQCKKDVEKLEIHKTQWQKEEKYATEQKEAVEQDEQGSATHTMKKRQSQTRKKGPKKDDH